MQKYKESYFDEKNLDDGLPTIDLFANRELFAETSKQARIISALNTFFEVLEEEPGSKYISLQSIDYAIAKIDQILSTQLDEIIHSNKFNKYASVWQSLKFLIDKIDFTANIELDLLNISKEDLSEDFKNSPSITYSALYKHVYNDEYDMPGATPVSVMISDYNFTAKAYDIELLKQISFVAETTHCPFIANVGADFFLKDSVASVMDIQDFATYFNKAEYIKFNALRDLDSSRFIGLTFPKFLLRVPYGEESPVKQFGYNETISTGSGQFNWGSASFAFAANLAQSFKQYGWLVNIRGLNSGGKISDLPICKYNTDVGLVNKIPTEVLIPESKELALAEAGIISLSYYKDTDFACFFSANSIQLPKLYDTHSANANARVNTRLPYVFLTARIGHYLKVIQRENIGALKDPKNLEDDLNRWLKTLVTKMNAPDPNILATHPLKEANVIVRESEDNPGFFKVDLYIQPHFQIEGVDISLLLVAKIPQASK